MKLYPLLFLNEDMRPGSDALAEGLAAIFDSNSKRIILFSPSKFKEFVEKAINENGRFTTDDILKAADPKARIIFGYISYDDILSDLTSVSTSGAISGFGPLMYQLLMYVIKPSWLMSDTSLKPASLKVWQKMYELSEKNVYERTFLRTFSQSSFMSRTDLGDDVAAINAYLKDSYGDPYEKRFYEWLKANNKEPKEFGFLWAYRKKDFDGSFGTLLDNGEKAVQEILDMFNINKQVISRIGAVFFTNVYGTEKSY